MRSSVRIAGYAMLVLLGVAILYSAWAHPPLQRTQLAYALDLNDDTGVHLDADWTIDYYKADSMKTFENAHEVFVLLTGIGAGLALRGVHGVRESTRRLRAGNDSRD